MGLSFKTRAENVTAQAEQVLDNVGRTAVIAGIAFGLVSVCAIMALLISTAALAEARGAGK